MTSHRAKIFDSLFGFPEESSSYGTTQQKLLGVARFASEPSPFNYRERCDFVLPSAEPHRGGDRVVSTVVFSVPSVAELHRHVQRALRDAKDIEQLEGGSSVRVQNIVGEARSLHTEPQNRNAVVQAASQFNLLEMPGPYDTPEDGIAGYEDDNTQGPACAIACAAGTAYRNYLVPVPFVEPPAEELSSSPTTASVERRGQTSHNQINTLEDIETYLRDVHGIDEPWQVRNGYVESSRDALAPLNDLLRRDPTVSTELIQRLRIGVQEQCHVTDAPALDNDVRVTQTYNSAVSIGYSRLPSELWERMARLVLNGTYEATLLVGVLETLRAIQERREVPPVLLTMVGGGVFKNKGTWIVEAMERAVTLVATTYPNVPLDVRIVHFASVRSGSRYRSLERPYPRPKGAPNR